ncbi:C40 family peptidase [Alkaliphilus sp. MSJ-5]|uniref:C40 family peptidase n=1 Tax=Alkaliphilus flagellatus TaxID=2841507 RepID=A0ABS6G774_9FIRM|nr:NlpC/P60 family protein [Alkaliphilus flagellatus]MBU5677251.1 C40 family peptidase [Alkaliphilus flagellatus]
MDNNLQNLMNNSIKWALNHLNRTDYTLRCLGFVEDALERSNSIEIFGGDTAKESADLYEAHRFKGIPPKGTFVFYDCFGVIDGMTKNWGHVGLAIEDGKIIHAWDKVRIDDYKEIEHLLTAPGWEKPQYIGWVSLERILIGHRTKIYE